MPRFAHRLCFRSGWHAVLLMMMLGLFVCSVRAAGVTAPSSNRVTINLGQSEWKFIEDADPPNAMAPRFDDSSWQSVGIPHSWNDKDTFLNHESGGDQGLLGGRIGWYRKHFTLEPRYADRKVLVEFEGAHVGVQVYINGVFVQGNSALNPNATHVVGFVPFIVDITNQVKFDGSDNVLAVKVAKNDWFFNPPGFSEVFRFGQSDGGLFRPVWMYLTDKVHIPQNVYAVLNTWGTYVSTISASESAATIRVQTNVLNESGAEQAVTLTTQIVDAAGQVVATAQAVDTVPANQLPGLHPRLFDQTLQVSHPTLWYPNNSLHGGPYLYRVFHIVSIDGAIVDAAESPLGIRTIVWDKNFPIINGKPHFLWGASGRYDYPALGSAVPEEQQWRDLKLLAQAGGSLWRPGHSPSSPEFVAAADAYGVMLVQPSGDGENGFAVPCATPPCDVQTLKSEVHRDLIVRDRNHPSILAWEADNGVTDTAFAQSLKALSRVWDPINTRAQSDRTPNPANGDILGCTNQGCETITKALYPDSPAWGSEYWGTGSLRHSYDSELAFAAQFLDNWRRGVALNAFGMAQWYLADTPGESSTYIEGIPHQNVRSLGASMMDANRIPKLLYHVYRAAWTPYSLKPVVALAHHWNRSGTVRVNAFSNCPKVRLLLNGVAQGEDQAPNPWYSDTSGNLTQSTTLIPFQVHWDVAWAAGTLTAQCLNGTGGVVASDQRVTAGPADHLVLSVEPGLVKPDGEAFAITANGSDVAFIQAKVVDAAGNWVPTADQNISFAVNGPATYRGGADSLVTPAQPVGYHAPGDVELRAEGGLTKVAVKAQFTPGQVTVSASAPGLRGDSISFPIVPVPAGVRAEALKIVAAPLSQTVVVGQSARFEVIAAGAAPLAYQWQRNGVPIAGATRASYTTAPAEASDNGASLTVVVSNAGGSVTSAPAILTVVAPVPPAIVVQPADQTVVLGQSARFSVSATGSPAPTYQWQRNGADIAGATASAYDTPPATVADNGAVFAVRVSNSVGSIVSGSAVLTVNAAIAPVITRQPASQSVVLGQSATLSIAVDGSPPLHYQWMNGTNPVGPDAASYTIASVQASDVGNYSVTVSNAGGSVTSAVASITLAVGKNLALGAAATSSGSENAGVDPSGAVDGKLGTRWSSPFADPSWIALDLGAEQAFNQVVLRWEAAYGKAYQIQVSNDNLNWTTVYTQTAGAGGNETLVFPTVTARYVRMFGTQRATPYGYSLWEFEIYNAAKCGGANERYTVLDAQTVQDNGSSLVWQRTHYTLVDQGAQFTRSLAAGYCAQQGMRLPTQAEALAISGLNAAQCAFPAPWSTWTSTDYSPDPTYAYWVSSAGNSNLGVAENMPGWALCVRAGGTPPPEPVVAPRIVASPADQTVAAGQSAHFSVSATGTAPLAYQWFKNGSPVANATAAAYDTPATTAADDGAAYHVVVSNGAGSATSTQAILHVTGGGSPNPDGGNLALGRSVSASGVESAAYPAANAVDGNLGTRWSSAFVDPSWIAIDLGAPQTFNCVVLHWEAAYGKAYQIQVSNDNQSWTTVYAQTAGAGGTETLFFPSATARYVRLFGMARATPYGYSLWGFDVYNDTATPLYAVSASATGNGTVSPSGNLMVGRGQSLSFTFKPAPGNILNALTVDGQRIAPAASYTLTDIQAPHTVSASFALLASSGNLALGMAASASGEESAALPAAAAVDGKLGTRWSSAFVDPSWLAVDLGSAQSFNRVVLRWEAAYGKAYQIQVSGDQQNWTTVYQTSEGAGGTEAIDFPTVSARYVRMLGTGRASQYGYSLLEFEVYNMTVLTPPAITAQPLSQAVSSGSSAHFAVTADGSPPLAYQWFENGAPIAGAVAASYDTPALGTGDDGDRFTVTVSNAAGTQTSEPATVRVTGAVPPYIVTPGYIGVDLQNNTQGRWSDEQVYVAVIARDPATGQFAWLRPDGTIVPAAAADNDAPGHLTKSGQNYSNYFFTLAQGKQWKLPKMYSGRIFVSAGSPMYIRIVTDANGQIGFAGPDVMNPTDPNSDVYFDWYEFAYNDTGLWINTTQVDQFGLPLLLDAYAQGGTWHRQTGISQSRAALFNAYLTETPAPFNQAPLSPYRIMAPAKSVFGAAQPNGTYFDAYVASLWSYYASHTLTLDLAGQRRRFTGQVQGTQFVFTEVNLGNGAYVGGAYVVDRPSTQDIFQCSNVFATGNATELAIQAQLCAAFNRHIVDDPANWLAPSAWYAASPANWYAKFWHDHSVGGLAYGFPYDDVADQSSTIMVPDPEHLVLGIGW